jgi:hypothetical protein
MTIKENLTKEERHILRSLKEDESIIICPADKGKAVVVEDRSTYLNKMQDQIEAGDYEVSKRSEKSLLDKIHKKLVAQFKKMGLDKFVDRRQYLVTAPVIANMYLLIKVHKKNFPGRAVVSQLDDPTYNVCKELTKILKPLSESGRSFLKNTADLKEMLKDILLDDECLLASLDVVALYPSIPVKKALEIVQERLENDKTLEERTKWKVEDIMKLLEISMETHFITLDGTIYTQTDGCPIGKSISGEIAEIYMDWFEEKYVFDEENSFKPIFWKRMRDDIFLVWKDSNKEITKRRGSDDLDQFLWKLNGKERRIQFTLEREKAGVLPFLDMSIKRQGKGFITKVYRKETHTQRYINWRSNHPRKCLLGVLKGLIHRAHLLCDLKEDLLDELDLLRDVFIANGYPTHLVEETIKQSWSVEMIKAMKKQLGDKQNKQEEDYLNVLHAPYIQGFSEKIQKELSKLDIGFVMKKGKTLQSELCKLKPKRRKEECKNVVYCIECKTCQKKYIGETGQQFLKRKYQHKQDVKNKVETNGIFQHCKNYKKHRIDWEKNMFIDREENGFRRKIKESVYINAWDPLEKNGSLMNIEKGVKLNSCWNEFNAEIRKLANKACSTKNCNG